MPYKRLLATRLTISIPALIVTACVCVAAAAGTMATQSFYSEAKHDNEAGLLMLARSKAREVSAVIHATERDLTETAGSTLVGHALANLATSIKIMPPERRATLDADYPATTAIAAPRVFRGLSDYYGRAFDDVHPLLRELAQSLGADDLLFIDADGNVDYSLARRSDFAANVHGTALQGSVLSDLFGRAAVQPVGAAVLTDFQPYGPAGHPVALIGTPVYIDQGGRRDLVGVLALELPRERINALLRDLGPAKGAPVVFLLGSDGRMRSDPPGRDDMLRTRFTAPELTTPRAGGFVAEYTLLGDTPMIAATMPLWLADLRWTVVAAQNSADVLRPVWQMIWRLGVTCGLVTLALGCAAAALAARLARPVVKLAEHFEAALTNMSHGLVMFDAGRRMILCNPTYRELYELPAALSRPGTPIEAIEAHRREQEAVPAEPARAGLFAAVQRRSLIDGRTIDVTVRTLPGGGWVATHHNVTASISAQRQITFLATHDALTGLPNRVDLGDRVTEALRALKPAARPAVLCLDLDDFKAVNDSLGHSIGDLLLKAAADRMAACLDAGSDLLARLGGDEFVVYQGAASSPEDAQALAQRLIDAVALPFEIDGHRVLAGLSVGIAIFPQDGQDADGLIKNADLALARAKAGGRGSYRFFEPAMDAELQGRRQLELDLREALAEGHFELAYQPIYNAVSERPTGVEALIRWNHPRRGLVSPADFIPLAEGRGLIAPIGEWVLRQACLDAVAWPDDMRVAVNLSPLQLKSASLVDTVVDALATSGLAPQRLELEITETVLLGDDAPTLDILHRLRRMGVRIAMDDFGTGYSSLRYLRSFPFDKIKIDRSFVQELDTREDAAAIIRTIAELGATLGMTTTVEGVETREQLNLVRRQGCTEVQGYYLCRPTRAAEITRLFAQADEPLRQTA